MSAIDGWRQGRHIPLGGRHHLDSAKYLADIAPLLFPRGFRHRFIMTLQAYCDLGASPNPNPHTIALCGYVATVERWQEFNGRWDKVLLEAGLKDVPGYFHMTDFNAKKGPYRNWTQGKRDRIFGQLAALIDTLMLGSAVALVVADYTVLGPQQQKQVGSPFTICAAWTLGQISRWMIERQVVEQVRYTFEAGDVGAARIVEAINEDILPQYRDMGNYVLATGFEDKRRFPGLQAADILAFETCRYVRIARGIDARTPRHSLARILHAVPTLKRWVDTDMLSLLLTKQTPEGRAAVRRSFGFIPRVRRQRKRKDGRST